MAAKMQIFISQTKSSDQNLKKNTFPNEFLMKFWSK